MQKKCEISEVLSKIGPFGSVLVKSKLKQGGTSGNTEYVVRLLDRAGSATDKLAKVSRANVVRRIFGFAGRNSGRFLPKAIYTDSCVAENLATEPETQETVNYWAQYSATKQDPAYKAEQQKKKRDDVAPLRGSEYDLKKHSPADPSDPDAYVPTWVRFAKRQLVNFTCPITGWKESDWIKPINGDRVRLVGELTLDHKLARSKNGRTTDENTRMICSLANGKKGDRNKTDEEIRHNLLSNYVVVPQPPDLLVALQKYGITGYSR